MIFLEPQEPWYRWTEAAQSINYERIPASLNLSSDFERLSMSVRITAEQLQRPAGEVEKAYPRDDMSQYLPLHKRFPLLYGRPE